MILAADVGATTTRLGLFAREGGRVRAVRVRDFRSGDASSFEDIVREFLRGDVRRKATRCAVGVAGPITAGRSQVVNLPWQVDAKRLARELRLRRVHLLNDVEAWAHSIPSLTSRQLANLTPRLRPAPGNAALIAAGTGLGMAILFWDGRRHRPSASEGGHQGLAPHGEVEIELLRYLARRHGRVSLERAVSGPGLGATYEFLVETGRGSRSPALERRMQEADPNAAIAAAGVAGEDPTAVKAVDLFVSLYGAAAGDLALVARATAGVFLGGGIAPRILPKLRDGAFMRAFRDKGRLSPFVGRVPVRVILEPRAGLIGAAAFAAAVPG